MCGIAGIHVKERYKGQLPLDDMLDYLLVHIAERGKHATGFVSVNFGGKGVTLSKKDVEAAVFIGERAQPDMEKVQTILAHTRWATQGPQHNNENNHPVVFGTCFATHNGHISNDAEVVEEFDLKAHRPAEVDSIAIPIALASCGMGSIENIKKGLEKLAGGMACAVIDPIKHPGKVVLAKGSTSPLFVLHHRTGFYWASTKEAIEFMWGNLIGTPPQNKTTNPNQLGWYEMKWGEGWVIEGDEAAPFKFTPAVTRWAGSSNYGDWSTGGSSGRGFRSTTTTRASSIRKFTRWLCIPNSKECVNPCDEGCTNLKCLCRETIWEYKGKEYRFDPIDIEKRDRETETTKLAELPEYCSSPYACYIGGGCLCPEPPKKNCITPIYCGKKQTCHCYGGARTTKGTSDGDSTDNSNRDGSRASVPGTSSTLVEGKVRCDSCWDWFNTANLATYLFGNTSYDLCVECAMAEEWIYPVSDSKISVLPDENNDPDPTMDHYQAVAEAANEAHREACAKTADSLTCQPDFVEWILFKATLEEMEEGGEALQQTRKIVEEEYEVHYDEGING